MKTVMLSTLAAAAVLLSTTVAHAGLEAEGLAEQDRTSVQIVATPPVHRPFGIPNRKEFGDEEGARPTEVRIVPHPKSSTPYTDSMKGTVKGNVW
jgi:hypothetical protein